MLSVYKNNKLCAQDKTKVINGKFKFAIFSNMGTGYEKGSYLGSISLGIPSVQSKKFIEKAGIQYENITGRLVDRTGIGPTINYTFKIEI